MKDKVYIVIDDTVWEDDPYLNIVAVTKDKSIAEKILSDYVKDVKEEINFRELEVVEVTDDLDYSQHESDLIYNESERDFYLYKNDEYNSNHIDISIIEEEIKK